MKIHGLQKMTLLDYPGKVACTVFLGGCEFRCPYCHNTELLDMNAPELMDDIAFLEFLKRRTGLLDGVAVTGGEPLLRNDISSLLDSIKNMGFLVKLDTNGNHPDRLQEVVEAGLVDYVAMDVKNSRERYGETIGLPGFDISRVEKSVEYLLSDQVEYEFRTTVVKQFHDESSFIDIARWIEGAQNYYIQSFVDRDTVPFGGLEACSMEELEKFREIVRPHVKNIEIRGV
ncbi:MAG: anaerobic ribonucleoside-triphosphate reductase activating protein [Eubacterium sp.]|nr:anaerobic ribonucleoside-triphosphate reductase activating protein [Eubacterium sp.]